MVCDRVFMICFTFLMVNHGLRQGRGLNGLTVLLVGFRLGTRKMLLAAVTVIVISLSKSGISVS